MSDLFTPVNFTCDLFLRPAPVIADDGKGLPEGHDYRKTTSPGLQLVNLLTEQLRRSREFLTGSGTAFQAEFGAKKSEG